MKATIFTFLCSLLPLAAYTQIVFEPGYFVDNENLKTDCLIKNIDWKNNPTAFEYKVSESGELKTADIAEVKEFGVYDFSKYIKSTVEIDKSSDQLNELTTEKQATMTKEELFLKVLVEGDASLYYYENGDLKRYFFNTSDTKIEQLIRRRYIVDRTKIAENNRYKQQLFNSLKCESIAQKDIYNLDHTTKQLIAFFEKYNTCSNAPYVNYDEKPTRDAINLTLRPSIRSSSLLMANSVNHSAYADFDSKLSFGIGLELEYVLPINKNKWSVIVEPTYQYYKSKAVRDFGTPPRVNYKSLEIPLGLRHYFFLNADSKLFANVSYVIDIDFNSIILLGSSAANNIDINPAGNIAMGMGYKFQNKFSVEARYQTKRNVLVNYIFWSSEYKTMSLIFGYSFF